MFFLFGAWCVVPVLDAFLPVKSQGLSGFHGSGHYFHETMNTQFVSALLCPVAFFFGVAMGERVGGFVAQKLRSMQIRSL